MAKTGKGGKQASLHAYEPALISIRAGARANGLTCFAQAYERVHEPRAGAQVGTRVSRCASACTSEPAYEWAYERPGVQVRTHKRPGVRVRVHKRPGVRMRAHKRP